MSALTFLRLIFDSFFRSTGSASDPQIQDHQSLQPLSAADISSETVTLPNGRRIGYSVYGPNSGTPIIFLHGSPGSRLDAQGFAPVSAELNCRLISVDRPGFGLSSPFPARTISGYPADVIALADHLNLDTFRVFGASGGGPYALACAAALPRERLLATGVAIGLGQPDAGRQGLGLGRYLMWRTASVFPSLIRWMATRMFGDGSEASIEWFLERSVTGLSPEERDIILKPENMRRSVMSLREAVRQGVDGYVKDTILLSKPWGLDLSGISGRVRLWYGGQDIHVPEEMGRCINDKLPNSKLTVYPDATHGTLLDRYKQEVFEQLLTEE